MGLALAALSAAGLAAAAAGTRFGLWEFRTGFSILRGSAYAGIAAGAVCLVLTLLGLSRGTRPAVPIAVLGLAFGLVAVLVPVYWSRKVAAVPRIHDISTDTEDPPMFSAVLPLRKAAMNPPEYPGPEVAGQQKAAYPDLAPKRLALPPAEAFARALAAAKALRWQIVAADEGQGRLEAVDTTFWFGFKDDVVVRVRPEPGGSRVDVRSKSRVGRSDLGKNAARIREFLGRL